MERFPLFSVMMILVFFIQGLNQVNAKECQRTNRKPWRYCVDKNCTQHKDCGKNEKCLCDGDCGLSCITNDLKCTYPRKPRNAILKITGAPGFQQTVTYTCKNGYTLRGPKKRTCRGIGQWDGRNTRCPRLCADPGDITFGNKDRDRKFHKVGSIVRYWCFPGYERQGTSKIKCSKDGSWSASPPKCTLPFCQKPEMPQNARSLRKLKSKYRFNDIVSFTCQYGYFNAGARYQRCLHRGKWSGNELRCIPKSCGDPGTPKNGKRIGYVFTFKRKVYYACHRGYIRIGPEFRQCHSNQKWSGDTPTCEPIDCRSLPTPQNGVKIEETKTTFLGKVTFQCKKKGYELKGSSTRVCQEDGRWDGKRTTCEPVQCKDPGKLDKGGRNPDIEKYVYEHKITFKCKQNHTLKGNSFIICQHDKSWTGNVPKCLAPCPDPGIPKGCLRHSHSFLHDQKVSFSSQKGWKLEGQDILTCKDGKWNQQPPKCLEGCKPPRSPTNGGIHGRKEFYNHGQHLYFYCSYRYERVGDRSAQCLNGAWNNGSPSCKRKCANPGSPNNGWRTGKDFFDGKKVTFTCNRGYGMIGLQTIQCLNTGQWSGQPPLCKRRCNIYRVPQSSIAASNPIQGQTVVHGTTITYRCTSGYVIEGQKTLRCTDGRWSSGFPRCKAPCSDPGPIENGGRIVNGFSHGETVGYHCSRKYTMIGSEFLRCNNGRWDKRVPTCKESCRDPGIPRNGMRAENRFEHGKHVSYDCKSGTRLVGARRLTCNDGKWSSVVPRCLEICYNPESPLNGYKNGKSISLSGDKITFSCKRDYDLQGSKEMLCFRGTWKGTLPQCLGRCESPSNIGSVLLNPVILKERTWYRHGTRLRFGCNQGKELNGQNETVCLDGSWSNDFPECKVPCTEPSAIKDGSQSGSRFQFRFWCDDGFTLVGSSTIHCNNNGVWSDNPPRCLRNCPDPGVVINGWISGNNFQHGKMISFWCNRGYQLRGRRRVQCDNGQWTSKKPACIGVCPDITAPLNGELLDRSFESGATIRFRCNDGYTLLGPQNITCNDKQWSYKAPVCKADCTDPGTLLNGIRHASAFSHNSIVNFTCNNHFLLVGASQIQCKNGVWRDRKPVCEAKCTNPGSPPKATSHFSVSEEGRQTITFSCPSFMVVIGQPVLTCFRGTWSHDLPSCADCGSSLGIENRKIPDASIKASSYMHRYRRPRFGRLHGRYAWCSTNTLPYLEVDLGKPYRITSLATQGSARDGKWVKKFVVGHTLARSSLIDYREDRQEKIFTGNKDATSVVKHILKNPFIARKVRFSVINPNRHQTCLRVEIYGCDLPKDCILVGSRVLGKWGSTPWSGDYYYKAYVKTIDGNDVQLELENEKHHDTIFKTMSKTSIVLDYPPNLHELRIGTRVLALKNNRYYSGRIFRKSGNYYIVSSFGSHWFSIDQLRLPRNEKFCE